MSCFLPWALMIKLNLLDSVAVCVSLQLCCPLFFTSMFCYIVEVISVQTSLHSRSLRGDLAVPLS